MIDWASTESHLLLNPRMPEGERARLETLYRGVSLPGHVWLATSGTTGSMKLAGLSKEAILASARAVNEHLAARAGDVWCCVLPTFHVGGLAIHARAALTGSPVLTREWDPRHFEEGGYSLASLVPAQVDDLVREQRRAPGGLRAVVVGGGALPDRLYRAGRDLGWPLLPSYGLTEAASQVATATVESRALRLLRHLEARVEDGRIWLRGTSLLTGYLQPGAEGRPELADPKREGWLDTGDAGEVTEGIVDVLGRGEDFVKVGGESVDLCRLDAILEEVGVGVEAAVVGYPDSRLGSVVHVAMVVADASVARRFNERVLPFERARVMWELEEIPRTELRKVRRSELYGRIADGRFRSRTEVR